MRIVVVGPGAMGCLLAAYVARAGHDTWLLDHRPDRARSLNRRGLRVETPRGRRFDVRVQATADPGRISSPDLIIVAVKSYATATAAAAAALLLGPATAVLTLQNGLGNVETLAAAVDPSRVLGGVTAHGAHLVAPGRVRHAGTGETVIGRPAGVRPERGVLGLRQTADLLTAAGFPTCITRNLPGALWGKVVVNAAINPVGALVGVPNGALVAGPPLRALIGRVAQETAGVAAAADIRLPFRDPVARTEEVCRRTAANLNSMLQDILAGRRTEIDAISGKVAETAAALGHAAPLNAALRDLVRGLETKSSHPSSFAEASIC